MSRNGRPYTKEEDDLIRMAFVAKSDINVVASHLGRTPTALDKRAVILGVAPPKRSKKPIHRYSAKGGAIAASKPISTLSAEKRLAHLMGNKRYEDYPVKRIRQVRYSPALPDMSLTGSSVEFV